MLAYFSSLIYSEIFAVQTRELEFFHPGKGVYAKGHQGMYGLDAMEYPILAYMVADKVSRAGKTPMELTRLG